MFILRQRAWDYKVKFYPAWNDKGVNKIRLLKENKTFISISEFQQEYALTVNVLMYNRFLVVIPMDWKRATSTNISARKLLVLSSMEP